VLLLLQLMALVVVTTIIFDVLCLVGLLTITPIVTCDSAYEQPPLTNNYFLRPLVKKSLISSKRISNRLSSSDIATVAQRKEDEMTMQRWAVEMLMG
jgi:hypothetical protein